MSELPTSPEHHPFSPTLEGAAQTTLTHGFEEPTVVSALGAPPGAAGPEYLQHRRPILLCHPRQHGRLLPNRPAKCHRSTNVGIHSLHTQPNPSTRPSRL